MDILELKNTKTEIKSSVDGLNSKMEGTKRRMSELAAKIIESTQSEQQR